VCYSSGRLEQVPQPWGPTKFLLNSPIITGWGRFSYRPIPPEEARQRFTWVGKDGVRRLKASVVSAIGHRATAEALALILGVESVPYERRTIHMQPGDEALVIRLTFRLPEGYVVESLAELEELNEGRNPLELGLLVMEE